MSTDTDTLTALYRTMVRIRAFENAAEQASQGGVSAYGKSADGSAKVRGPLHLSTGQEAVPAGVCAHLRADDYLTSTHRGHGHTLAKGADLQRMMNELFGKADGTNGGKGGSMHIADFSVGMLGANGVVAAGLPIAVGAAHAPFLEALNWAQVYQLPVLFVCEDNRWSATTASGPMTAGAGASARAASLDIPCEKVDGNDVLAVHASAAQLIAHVRGGSGPRLLHAVTYRVKGHVSVDLAAYRDPAELQAALLTDPIARARESYLSSTGSQAQVLDAIEREAEVEVATALAVAHAAAWPQASAAYTDVQTVGDGQWL